MSVTQESPQNHIAGGSTSASAYVSTASVAARIFISFDLHSHSITRPVPDPEMVGRTGVGYQIRLFDRDAGVTDESITNLADTTTAISYKQFEFEFLLVSMWNNQSLKYFPTAIRRWVI